MTRLDKIADDLTLAQQDIPNGAEAEAFRDEHLEGAPATTWPSVTLPVPHEGRAAFIEKGAFPL